MHRPIFVVSLFLLMSSMAASTNVSFLLRCCCKTGKKNLL